MFVTWPNFISLGRLLSAPFAIWLILSDAMVAAFWLTIIAGASDFFDGLLARSLKWHSAVGAYLDPLADKVLLVALFGVLGMKGWIPLWLMIGAIFRDALIVGGTLLLWIVKKPVDVKPILISKINTVLQIGIVLWILSEKAFFFDGGWILRNGLFWLTGMTTTLSGAFYICFWVRLMNADTEKESPL